MLYSQEPEDNRLPLFVDSINFCPTLVMLPKWPNRHFPVAVVINQLRTLASKRIDPVERPLQ